LQINYLNHTHKKNSNKPKSIAVFYFILNRVQAPFYLLSLRTSTIAAPTRASAFFIALFTPGFLDEKPNGKKQ